MESSTNWEPYGMQYSLEHLLTNQNQFHAARMFCRYFAINEKRADLDLLQHILECFSEFPYENISKIIKYNRFPSSIERIRLPCEVMEDHIVQHLGGTCFSLTYFLETVLKYHGFSCYPVVADMQYGKNVHCALVVLLDQKKLLVDPGYLVNEPIQLNNQDVFLRRNTFSGIQLLYQHQEQKYRLFTCSESQRTWRYSFFDRPVPKNMFLKYWLASFTWNSMHGLCLTKIEKDKMIYIHKHFMRETTRSSKRNFNIRDKYSDTIHEIFDISSDLIEDAMSALEHNLNRDRERGLWIPKRHSTGVGK